MNPEITLIAASAVGAIIFFLSGYFFGSPPSRAAWEVEPELGPSNAPSPAQGFSVPAALTERNVGSLLDMLRTIEGHYGANNLGIYDSDGLLVQGVPGDPQLGLRVASLAHGLGFIPSSTQAHATTSFRLGSVSIQAISCRTRPLWLALHGADRDVCEADRARLGAAVDREVCARAA